MSLSDFCQVRKLSYKKDNNIFLAVEKRGLYAFEEFVLARYFMFVQVYFHKTRRLLDKMLVNYLREYLPGGRYPEPVFEYLTWDDARVWEMIRADEKKSDFADRIINRKILKKYMNLLPIVVTLKKESIV